MTISSALLLAFLGTQEIILLLVAGMVLFGVGKIPQLGDALGKGIRNFKKSVSGQDEIDVTPPKKEIEDK